MYADYTVCSFAENQYLFKLVKVNDKAGYYFCPQVTVLMYISSHSQTLDDVGLKMNLFEVPVIHRLCILPSKIVWHRLFYQ